MNAISSGPDLIGVLIVYDDAAFRGALAERLKALAPAEMIDTAGGGREAIDRDLALRPDVCSWTS